MHLHVRIYSRIHICTSSREIISNLWRVEWVARSKLENETKFLSFVQCAHGTFYVNNPPVSQSQCNTLYIHIYTDDKCAHFYHKSKHSWLMASYINQSSCKTVQIARPITIQKKPKNYWVKFPDTKTHSAKFEVIFSISSFIPFGGSFCIFWSSFWSLFC